MELHRAAPSRTNEVSDTSAAHSPLVVSRVLPKVSPLVAKVLSSAQWAASHCADPGVGASKVVPVHHQPSSDASEGNASAAGKQFIIRDEYSLVSIFKKSTQNRGAGGCIELV